MPLRLQDFGAFFKLSWLAAMRGLVLAFTGGWLVFAIAITVHHGTLGSQGIIQSRRRCMTGKIRTLRVDKGFGFIKDDAGNEYFFHQSAVYGEGIQDLREGDSVEFDVGQGPKGPRAENVKRTST